MTNHPIADTEQERRTQASAANHGGVHVLDADRPQAVGAPAITHQTTNDPYTAAPAPVDPTGIDAANRLVDPTLAPAAQPRSSWGTLLLALLLIVAAIWLITWLL